MGSEIVPVIAGLTLIVGGAAALWVDRRDLLNNVNSPRPIMIRYTSQATYDLKKRPHWIFLLTNVLFAPLLVVTVIWQAQLALELDDVDQAEKLSFDLQLNGFITAFCCVLVAGSPMGTDLGTILHMLFASGIASFGLTYCVRAQELASERSMDRLAMMRQLLWIMGQVGAGILIVSLGRAGTGTKKLKKHEAAMTTTGVSNASAVIVPVAVEEELEDGQNPKGIQEEEQQEEDKKEEDKKEKETEEENVILTPQQIRNCRLWETGVAIGQIAMALMMGLVTMTAVVEVGDVSSPTNTANVVDPLLAGLVSAGAACVVGGSFYALNNFFVRMCQTSKEEEGEGDTESDKLLAQSLGNQYGTIVLENE